MVCLAEAVVVFRLEPVAVAITDTVGLMIALSITTMIIVTFRRRVNQLLSAVEAQALTDPLTGLANRRAFERHLRRAVAHARSVGRPVSLLAVDLDHFKTVNDTYGHAAGDAVLKAVADAMRDAVRGSNLVARLGGDEFAAIVDADAGIAERIARQIRGHLAGAAHLPGGSPTLSIGLAALPEHAQTVESLLAAADAAMYRAKGCGRDRVASADAGIA